MREVAMATCETCGNEYGMTFEITTISGDRHSFDSFECAIHALAPRCEHCDCRVIGHGVEIDGSFYCCAHCARAVDSRAAERLVDAVGSPTG
ncbi:MAG TPA: hypothetical protein H9902_15105 [Candidatus Stackebrandtia faecavium]|nr:hypothetical protein [Candidatus Stackebrandtia faecavium]